MIDPLRDLASVREATERLLTAADATGNAAVPPDRHGCRAGAAAIVLAHLARNADALVNVLEGRPMYASGDARDADIERDAPRPLDVQLADLRDSAARFQAVGALPADWTRTVELRNGVTDAAARVPFRRLVEVELHHVDLGIGYELEDLPEEFTAREIDFLARALLRPPGRPADPDRRGRRLRRRVAHGQHRGRSGDRDRSRAVPGGLARGPPRRGGTWTPREPCCPYCPRYRLTSMTYSGVVKVGGPADVHELTDLMITKVAVGPMDNNAYLLRCRATDEQLLIDAANEPGTLLGMIGDDSHRVGRHHAPPRRPLAGARRRGARPPAPGPTRDGTTPRASPSRRTSSSTTATPSASAGSS